MRSVLHPKAGVRRHRHWSARRRARPFNVLLQSPELAGAQPAPGRDEAREDGTFGEQGVVDLIGVSGYYTLVSMVLNVAEIPPPEGVPPPW